MILLGAACLSGCLLTGQITSDSWSDDIRILRSELPRSHAAPFRNLSAKEWSTRLEALEGEAPNLAPAVIKARIREVLCLMGQGQTRLAFQETDLFFPLALYDFDNGLYTLAIDAAYRKLLGTRLVKIEGVPIEEVLSRLASQVPHSNQSQLRSRYPRYLVSLSLLKGIGIAEEDTSLRFIFENPEGRRTQATLKAQPSPPWDSISSPSESPQPVSIFSRKLDEAGPEAASISPSTLPDPEGLYSPRAQSAYTRLDRQSGKPNPEGSVLYYRWSSCGDPPDPKGMLSSLRKALSAGRISRMVVDLRYPGLTQPEYSPESHDPRGFSQALSSLIKSHDYIDLMVLIGRRTVGCSLEKALDFQQNMGAVLIGEPTGGRPNYYTQIRELSLPHSGLVVEYPTLTIENLPDNPDALYPDIYTTQFWEDYADGRDAALEEALSAAASP